MTTKTADPINPRTGRVDIVKRFRQWVDAGRPPLAIDETAICLAGVKDGDSEEADENGWRECCKTSSFIVERSDFSDSYGELGGGAEACDEHLWQCVYEMCEDETIRAVVTPRWKSGDEPAA